MVPSRRIKASGIKPARGPEQWTLESIGLRKYAHWTLKDVWLEMGALRRRMIAKQIQYQAEQMAQAKKEKT